MRLFGLLIMCLSGSVHAAEFKSAQKMAAGDVVSAEVLNDMFEQIEFNLTSADETNFLGTWNISQTVRWQGWHQVVQVIAMATNTTTNTTTTTATNTAGEAVVKG